MSLSEEQAQSVVRHLKSQPGGSACPVCSEDSWEVSEDVYFMGEFNLEYRQPVEGSVVPFVAVTCTECHNTRFFPAVRLGLAD